MRRMSLTYDEGAGVSPHWLGSRPPANPQQAVVGGKEVVSWLPRLLQGGASPHWLGSQPPAHLELAGGCRAAGAHRAAQTACSLSSLLWQSSAWAAAMVWPSWAVQNKGKGKR